MKILDLSYPNSQSKKEVIFSSASIGFLVYLFLLVFQPFGTQNVALSKLIYILFPYSVITTSIFTLTNLFFLNNKVQWTVSKEVSKIVLIIFICSILCYLYNSLVLSKIRINVTDFLYMVLYTCSIAIPLCSIYVLARFIYLKNQNRAKGDEISQNLIVNREISRYRIYIQDKSFVEDNLLFVESADNYCTFYYEEHNVVRKTLLRTTLKSVEEQIKSEKILRSHRSFIVNLKRVTSITGNAQGYKLKLKSSSFEIPVSRKYMEAVKKQLSSL